MVADVIAGKVIVPALRQIRVMTFPRQVIAVITVQTVDLRLQRVVRALQALLVWIQQPVLPIAVVAAMRVMQDIPVSIVPVHVRRALCAAVALPRPVAHQARVVTGLAVCPARA
ncbi:MAG: hypothetical protein HQL19_05190 [Candidatus Omnitrophica bacterium]|nr:hypothetical protein [Candidatus Omnitrophota bacterium]